MWGCLGVWEAVWKRRGKVALVKEKRWDCSKGMDGMEVVKEGMREKPENDKKEEM